MIRYVITKEGPIRTFWTKRHLGWTQDFSVATRYKKVEEAEKVAFTLAIRDGDELQRVAVEPSFKYERYTRWRVVGVSGKCPNCNETSGGKKDVYMCMRTCLGYRPQKHRHATCGSCGFVGMLMPLE